MFIFRARQVPDLAAQRNFEQLGSVLPGHLYSAAFTALGAGAGATVSVTVDRLPVSFLVVGSVNYTGAVTNQDQVTWAWRQTGGDTIEIAMHNYAAGAATGTVQFGVLGFSS